MPTIVVWCSSVVALVGWLATSLVSGRAAGAPGLRVVWHVAGEGRGMPAVSRDSAYFLSKRHEVFAFDRTTGRVRWRRSTSGPGEATLGARVVATATSVVAGDYDVVAFTHDGALRWRFTPAGGHAPGPYLGDALHGVVFAGSASGHLAAIDAESGESLWTLRLADDVEATVYAPAASGTIVVAGVTSFGPTPAGSLVAVDAATGTQRWRRPLPAWPGAGGRAAPVAGGPLIAGNLVLAGAGDGRVHAFDLSTGRLRWSLSSVTTGGGPHAPVADYRALAWAGGTLVAGSLTGVVSAFDVAAGGDRWQRAVIAASVAQGLAADGHAVYVPFFSGHLVAFRLTDGREIWRIGGVDDGFVWAPVVSGGRVFAAASGAGYFSLEAASRPSSRTGGGQ